MNAPTIEARAISKHFGEVHALTDVSLQVNEGEVLCLQLAGIDADLGPDGPRA